MGQGWQRDLGDFGGIFDSFRLEPSQPDRAQGKADPCPPAGTPALTQPGEPSEQAPVCQVIPLNPQPPKRSSLPTVLSFGRPREPTGVPGLKSGLFPWGLTGVRWDREPAAR